MKRVEDKSGSMALTPLDLESEFAVGRVRIDRERMPFHGIGARRQRLQLDVHLLVVARIDKGRPVIYGSSRFIGHLDPTKSWFQLLREPNVHDFRCGWYGTPNRWIGMVDERMRLNRARGNKCCQKHECCRECACSHFLFSPKILVDKRFPEPALVVGVEKHVILNDESRALHLSCRVVGWDYSLCAQLP